MVAPVKNLLRKLHPPPSRRYGVPVRISAHQVLSDFNDYLQLLVKQNVKKTYQEQYLVSCCFAKSKFLKTDAEVNAYCRTHLYIAAQQFQKLMDEMKGHSGGKISNKIFKIYSEIIREYVYDLKEIVEPLQQKKDQNYEFFSGGKNYGVMSWQVFRLSRQLAVQSRFRFDKSPLEHRTAQIASIFVLRQSLETKFEKLIGVCFHDKNGCPPRLRHDFQYNFIKNHIRFFDFKAVNYDFLRYVYDWCNEIVHVVYQPYAWQIAYAHEICDGLFSPIKTPSGKGWNINNPVEIKHADEMQRAYMEYFVNHYDHGIWAMLTRDPEAVCL